MKRALGSQAVTPEWVRGAWVPRLASCTAVRRAARDTKSASNQTRNELSRYLHDGQHEKALREPAG